MMTFGLRCILRSVIALGTLALATFGASAGNPRLDPATCKDLHNEQAAFIQTGVLTDMQKGAAWGRSNLSADRLRQIEQYILLDEQIKFACREATLTPEMERAGEIAKRLEANPNADPFAPLPEPGAEGAAAGEDADDKDDSGPAKSDDKAGDKAGDKAVPKTKAKPGTSAADAPAQEERPAAKDKPAKKVKAERPKADDALKLDLAKPDAAPSQAEKSAPAKSGWTNPDTGVRSVPLTTEPIR